MMEILAWPTTTHHGSLSQTDTNTLILQQIFIPFHDLCQLFSHPLQNRHLQCVSALRNRLQMVFILPATLHFIAASSSQAVLTHHPHLQFHCLSVLQLLHPLPNCIWIFYLTCSSNFCLCSGLCLISCYHKMFTEYFPVMMNTLLKVFIPPHPPPLFYLPHITGWQFFTFHTFHQKHLHLLFSILLLCLTFWFQAPEALALLFVRLSPGYLMLPSFTLSVYFQMFHTWSKM